MYDVAVIGGGSAGAVVAARLSEEPSRKVLLLDAGPPFNGVEPADRLSNVTFALTTRDWGIRATANGGRALDYPQGKAFGGGSSVNGALALRGEPDDYEGWGGDADDRWGWHHMLRCFRRLETDEDIVDEWHGADGPIPVHRWRDDELVPMQQAFRGACRSVGHDWVADHNRPASSGVGPFPMNRRDGIRVSTAIGYLTQARSRPNMTMIDGCHAHRLRISGGRVVGVDVHAQGGTETIEAGEFVVAAGALNTPALLLRSGIGPADAAVEHGIQPVVDLPGVGHGLVDHPGVFLLLHPRPGVVDTSQPQFQLGLRYSSDRGERRNDMLIGLMNFWDLSASPDFQEQVGAPMVAALTCGLQSPRSRGTVTLASGDPQVLPRVDLNMLDDPFDIDLLVDGLRHCWDIADSPMSDVVSSPALLGRADFDDDAVLRDYIRSMVAPWYHPAGTARLGADTDEFAVVDTELRVRGVDGLRIVDASVLPVIPTAPTNLTVIALAERAAELMTQ